MGPVVLIAHSHGGNIALWALDGDQKVRQRVAALLSLLAVIFIAFKVLVPKRDGVLAQLRGPSLDDVPILCVQTTDDEASNWLALLETQLNTPFLFLNLLSRHQCPERRGFLQS